MGLIKQMTQRLLNKERTLKEIRVHVFIHTIGSLGRPFDSFELLFRIKQSLFTSRILNLSAIKKKYRKKISSTT